MEPKKKDLMMASMDDFWGSNYTIPQPKINAPRIKSAEDHAFDAFWGRQDYIPARRIPSPTHGSKYVRDVKPVRYHPELIKTRTKLAQLQAELQRKQIEDKINAINARRMQQNINIARYVAKTGANVASATSKQVVKGIKNTSSDAVKFYNTYVKKKGEDLTKKPVGLAGAVYTANKQAGKTSIYD